jgi:hypothetical protein
MGEFPWTDQHTDQQSNFTYNDQIVETISLVLQTRQQLGINSLSLAAQSERSILALFG